jgi:hypothetical protein
MAIDEKTLEAVATALRDADGNAPAGYSWGQYADDARAAILAYEKAMAPTPETWNEKALSEGYRGKIDWIREYRARSNASLKDSKEAYERDAPMFVAARPAAELSLPVCEDGIRRTLLRLATVLHGKHYADVPQWQPFEGAYGLIDQIDNMTAVLAKPSGWQDISTAPKDGTWILLVTAGSEPPFVGMWYQNGWDDGDFHSGMTGMTHWQPLPSPPVGSGQNLADANPETPL